MKTLFHYTDVEGFFNIIKNKKLWLSGPHNLNDHQELHWAINQTHEELEKLTAKYSADHANEIWGTINRNRLTPFICSLSSNGDLLSQWRAYARDGTGVAIGFNAQLLPQTGHKPHYNASPKYCLTTLPVVYNEAEQRSTIAAILEDALIKMRDSKNWQTEPCILEVPYHINGLSTIYKNSAFKEESEWRIIHTPLITGNINTNKTSVMGEVSEIKHRVSNGRLITYFEYDFSHLVADGLIVDIILGPKCQIKKYDIELFLSLQGLEKIDPTRSRATYR